MKRINSSMDDTGGGSGGDLVEIRAMDNENSSGNLHSLENGKDGPNGNRGRRNSGSNFYDVSPFSLSSSSSSDNIHSAANGIENIGISMPTSNSASDFNNNASGPFSTTTLAMGPTPSPVPGAECNSIHPFYQFPPILYNSNGNGNSNKTNNNAFYPLPSHNNVQQQQQLSPHQHSHPPQQHSHPHSNQPQFHPFQLESSHPPQPDHGQQPEPHSHLQQSPPHQQTSPHPHHQILFHQPHQQRPRKSHQQLQQQLQRPHPSDLQHSLPSSELPSEQQQILLPYQSIHPGAPSTWISSKQLEHNQLHAMPPFDNLSQFPLTFQIDNMGILSNIPLGGSNNNGAVTDVENLALRMNIPTGTPTMTPVASSLIKLPHNVALNGTESRQQHQMALVSAGTTITSSSTTTTKKDSKASKDSTSSSSATPTKLGKKTTKTHVTKACSNCQRGHVACDLTRPCKRCVKLGRADTCVDGVQQKRGWRKGKKRIKVVATDGDANNNNHNNTNNNSNAPASKKPNTAGTGSNNGKSKGGSATLPITSLTHDNSIMVFELPPISASSSLQSSKPSPPTIGIILSTAGQILSVSSAYNAILGYSEDELIGFKIFDFIHPDDAVSLQTLLEIVIQTLNTNFLTLFRMRLKAPDSSGLPQYRWIEVQGTLSVNSETNQPMGILLSGIEYASFEDNVGEDLSDSPAAATFILKLSPDAIVADVTGGITNALGYNVEEFKGQWIMNFIAPDQLPLIHGAQAELLKGEKSECRLHIQLKSFKGVYKWLEVMSRVTRNKNNGLIEWLICTFRPLGSEPESGAECLNVKSRDTFDDIDKLREDIKKLTEQNQQLLDENRRLQSPAPS